VGAVRHHRDHVKGEVGILEQGLIDRSRRRALHSLPATSLRSSEIVHHSPPGQARSCPFPLPSMPPPRLITWIRERGQHNLRKNRRFSCNYPDAFLRKSPDGGPPPSRAKSKAEAEGCGGMARKAIIAAGLFLIASPVPALAQPAAPAVAQIVDPDAVAT